MGGCMQRWRDGAGRHRPRRVVQPGCSPAEAAGGQRVEWKGQKWQRVALDSEHERCACLQPTTLNQRGLPKTPSLDPRLYAPKGGLLETTSITPQSSNLDVG
eukprot:366479-Chlamydomonas_euryale.AAC.5